MVMVKLRPTHAHATRLLPLLLLLLLDGSSHGVRTRDPWGSPSGTSRTSHVIRRMRYLFAIVDFGHSAHSPTSKFGVLVAISPTVNGALDQTALAAQAGIEFC